ncbi:hypothetical protein WA026_018325 [Henosepilachna vigintioctopunctata]|uniref:AB hydrolase-1 domain-containing protein n=1 Tax=Henosepilachna vigintioctopunctata TaxID=420089 RepID=A0AAW1VIE0_9CUCU
MDEFSKNKLMETEQTILSTLPSYKTHLVSITSSLGTEEHIWTVSLNTESPNTPMVMLHGFAAGIGFWCLNMEYLSRNRPVYAIDILGFGRSSRPNFSRDSLEAEKQMIDALEAWRIEMKLEKIIFLGHSMGAYLSTLYAISYPDPVEHLVLADPWGFSDKYENPPMILKILAFLLQWLNPIGVIRYLGPYWGPLLLQKTRRDIFGGFCSILEDEILPRYFYYCNASSNNTGERAFYSMVAGIGWAKIPIVKRIHKLKSNIPMTFIFGSKTWMDKEMATRIKAMRPHSSVDMKIVDDAGHHIYSEQAEQFNEIVETTCNERETKKFK